MLAPGRFSFPDIIFICTLLLPLEFSFLSYRCKFFTPSFRDLLYGPRSPPSLRQGWRPCPCGPRLPRCSPLPADDDAAANFTESPDPGPGPTLASPPWLGPVLGCRVPVTAPLRMRTQPGTGPDPRPGSGDQSTLATPGPITSTRNSPDKSYPSRGIRLLSKKTVSALH